MTVHTRDLTRLRPAGGFSSERGKKSSVGSIDAQSDAYAVVMVKSAVAPARTDLTVLRTGLLARRRDSHPARASHEAVRPLRRAPVLRPQAIGGAVLGVCHR